MLKLIIGGAGSGKSVFAQGLIEADYRKFKEAHLIAGSDMDVERAGLCLARESKIGSRTSGLHSTELIYLATMDASDRESRKRIEKHIKMREGNGYRLIEMPKDLKQAEHIISPGSFVLIEDITNLCANEMFSGDLREIDSQNKMAARTERANETEKGVDEADSAEETDKNRLSDGKGYKGINTEGNNADINQLSEKIVSGIDKLSGCCREIVAVTGELFSDGILYTDETLLYLKLLSIVNYKLALRACYVSEIVSGFANVIKDEEERIC